MPEFRTATGLVACTPFLRTGAGLIDCTSLFFGQGGLVESGGGEELIVALEPSYASGARSIPGSVTVTTNIITASVFGGKPPYTYAWTGPATLTIASPAKPATSFFATLAPGGTVADDYTLTVTDARGATAYAGVSASVINFGGGGNAQP